MIGSNWAMLFRYIKLSNHILHIQSISVINPLWKCTFVIPHLKACFWILFELHIFDQMYAQHFYHHPSFHLLKYLSKYFGVFAFLCSWCNCQVIIFMHDFVLTSCFWSKGYTQQFSNHFIFKFLLMGLNCYFNFLMVSLILHDFCLSVQIFFFFFYCECPS